MSQFVIDGGTFCNVLKKRESFTGLKGQLVVLSWMIVGSYGTL